MMTVLFYYCYLFLFTRNSTKSETKKSRQTHVRFVGMYLYNKYKYFITSITGMPFIFLFSAIATNSKKNLIYSTAQIRLVTCLSHA